MDNKCNSCGQSFNKEYEIKCPCCGDDRNGVNGLEKLEAIKKYAHHYKEHDFFTTVQYEDYLWLIEQAEELKKYEEVFRKMKAAHDIMCKNIQQAEWTAGFGAGIDFIEENFNGDAE